MTRAGGPDPRAAAERRADEVEAEQMALEERLNLAHEAAATARVDALEEAAKIVEAEVTGVECDRFSVEGRICRNAAGHDLFISTPRASDLLRQRAAAIRALRREPRT